MFAAEFNAAVAETSTSNAAFIVAAMSKKLAFASQALMKKAKADDDLRVKRANESLSLAERLKRAKAEVQSLRDENRQLKCKCSKLETTASDNDKVLESLRKTVKNDTNEKAALKGRITELEAIQSKVDELKQVFTEVTPRAKWVYQEYKILLLRLEWSLCPYPSRPKVRKLSSNFWIG